MSSENGQPKADVWNIAYLEPERWPMDRLNVPQKWFAYGFGLFRVALLLCLLYIFIVSLGMLGSGFLILGGTTAGLTFRNNEVFNNPFAGTVIGILATVLVQSSSTSTSIIISMTAAGLLKVDHAVFMVMGANIGTSITNTLVALGQVHDKNQFRRAFGGATVHDMFNFLSVAILLPVEWATGILRHLAESSVRGLNIPEGYEAPNFIKKLTKPATSKIMSVDKGLIKKIGQETNATILEGLLGKSIVKWKKCKDEKTSFVYCSQEGKMSDGLIGFTLTLWAIILLCITLILIVKLLNYSLKGTTARALQRHINIEFPAPFGWLSDYLLLLFGVGLTILAQSSSITTSSLTPLVGIGLLKITKMFPITLGANVGTTTTGIMSAMGSSQLFTALTVAFCHLYFNVAGLLIWFVIPYMRSIPLSMAKQMGNITAEFRWFAAVYIIVAFVFVPLLLLGLSLAGPVPFGIIMGPILILSLLHLIVVKLRASKPDVLPDWLREYYWLPACLKKEPECLKEYHRRMVAKSEVLERRNTEKKLRRDAGEDLSCIDKIYMALGDGKLLDLKDSSSKSQLRKEENKSTDLADKKTTDVWNIAYLEPERWPFSELNCGQKTFAFSFGIFRVALLLSLLYIFIVSLGMLGSGFLILGGTTAGLTFRNNEVFDNPFAGTVIGILATVLVQSSSTSTSIIISMTAAGLLKVDHAVFMVMGANIGTSITNTLVALGQVHDKNQFRRAFGGATVHDMFNFLSVAILLPVEWATGILRYLAEDSVRGLNIPEGYEAPNFIKKLTKPATSKIMSVDKGLIKKIGQETNATILEGLLGKSIVKWKKCKDEKTSFVYCSQEGKMSDGAIGFTLTLWAIILLCITLILIVKLLNYSLKGTTARALQRWINIEFPAPFGWLADYLLLLFGVGLTILAQSSSITTSSLTPLVGIGLLKINKMFPITLGANVGTTTTGIMSAMGSSQLFTALTVAFCHLYFNVAGLLIWFVIPYMRSIPLAMAKHMGNITAEFRWFAAAYILVCFVTIPLLLLGLSLAGPVAFGIIMGPIIIFSILHLIVLQLRAAGSVILPGWLREYYWLPECLKKEPECLKEYHRRMVSKSEELERKNTEKKLRRDAGEDLTLVDKIYMALGDGQVKVINAQTPRSNNKRTEELPGEGSITVEVAPVNTSRNT